MKKRIYFLDNLRTFMIFLVVLLHAGLVYESVLENSWLVIDPVKNESIGLIRMYLDLFVMFTIFFVSGYFIPISVKNKNSSEFLISKFKRILLPWIVAVFTLIPAYKAIFLYSRGLAQEEWFSYFHVFQRTGSDLSYLPNNPNQNWLWFLPILFIFQVIYLILSKSNLLSMKLTLKTGVIMVFVLGVIYSMLISIMGLKGWTISSVLDFQNERLLIYLMSFLLGSLCYKLQVFESKSKNKKLYIISNVVLTFSLGIFTVVALNLFFNLVDPTRNYFFVSEWVDKSVYYISTLLCMLSFLHILIYTFQFNFNKSNVLMKQLNKNSYYVYIIHMIVLGLIAMILVPISIPVYFKFLILTLLTFTLSNLIVYAYRIFAPKQVSTRTATSVLVVACILTAVIYVEQAKAVHTNTSSTTIQTSLSTHDTGIHEAIIRGNIEVIKQHIASGSDLNEKEATGGSSPLITAAVFGQTEAALLLIEAGADVNLVNNDGSTPLHSAAFFCHTEIVEALLLNGADTNIKNNAGSTALAAVTGSFDSVVGIYQYFGNTLEPLGLKLDLEKIKETRPRVAEIIKNYSQD